MRLPRTSEIAALARAYLRIGDRIQASREYQRILQIAPDHVEAGQGLARLSGEGPKSYSPPWAGSAPPRRSEIATVIVFLASDEAS